MTEAEFIQDVKNRMYAKGLTPIIDRFASEPGYVYAYSLEGVKGEDFWAPCAESSLINGKAWYSFDIR